MSLENKMLDKEEAKAKIQELIDDFKANYLQYKKELEANTETKLIEPLFELLGWTKKDFVKQEKAQRGGRAGHADYAFYIGDKIVFFLEVKRVGIPLDKEADKQVISYALSKRIPFAVSTNFEELKIFCVEQEDALRNKFRVFNYTEYITNFEDLLFLSKESFEQGVILKKAESEGRLKKRVSIDKALLEDLMHIRRLIADDIEKTYPERYQPNEKDEIIQRIIGRLIFIRRCEDIGINPDNISLTEIRRLPDNKAYPLLKNIFKRYNEVYNGGLFAVAKDNDCDKIDINGAIIKKLNYYLYESKDKGYIYNFDWIDADVLGQVYEQYLGKILAQTKSGRAKLQNGQVHRKEQGIYYTPTYIVDYIVKNTVSELLKDKKVKAKDIKILDPACGSGSFLIKAFDYMYEHLSSDKKAGQYKIDSQGAYSVKTEILKNNIYGVDLDNKAVEITKLNLLLKAAEKNRRLPEEVDNKIKHGNSLIDDEKVAGLDAFKWEGDFKEGSFDVVIGNPPYVRIQTLDKKEVEWFGKENGYTAAKKGNYDIYVLFIEKALRLLKPGGRLGFIVPHKFFNAKYGEELRLLISDGKHLSLVVHFEDQQVFEGATTYTCLLFLEKTPQKSFRLIKVNNLPAWRESGKAIEGKLNISNATKDEWNFVVGKESALFEKLRNIPTKLEKVAKRIYQGVITSADTVYLFKEYRESKKQDVIEVFSKALNEWVAIESKILKRVVRSGNIGRYYADPTALVLFPYELKENSARLYSTEKMEQMYPLAWEYLKRNKKLLQNREKGKFKDSEWYRFGRSQNLGLWEQSKVMIPYMINRLSAYPDLSDYTYFVNVTTGGYGIVLDEVYCDLLYFSGLINSKLLDYYLKKVSTNFHGGYFAANKQYIEQLPIRLIDSNKNEEKRVHEQIVKLVKRMLTLNKMINKVENKKTAESAKIEDEIRKTDAKIDEIVYKIYGITEKEKEIIEGEVRDENYK